MKKMIFMTRMLYVCVLSCIGLSGELWGMEKKKQEINLLNTVNLNIPYQSSFNSDYNDTNNQTSLYSKLDTPVEKVENSGTNLLIPKAPNLSDQNPENTRISRWLIWASENPIRSGFLNGLASGVCSIALEQCFSNLFGLRPLGMIAHPVLFFGVFKQAKNDREKIVQETEIIQPKKNPMYSQATRARFGNLSRYIGCGAALAVFYTWMLPTIQSK